MSTDDPILNQIKCDGAALREVLGIRKDGNHEKCPVCGKPNNRVFPAKTGSGQYSWKCYGCNKNGSIVDAVMHIERVDIGKAIAIVKQRYGGPNRPRPAPRPQIQTPPEQEGPRYATDRPDPILDMERATDFIQHTHDHLMKHLDYSQRFKRGLSQSVIETYNIGFAENEAVAYERSGDSGVMQIPGAWVLPITNEAGDLKGVKLHYEIMPPNFKGKSRWATFGTFPKYDRANNISPVHSYYDLWPHVRIQSPPGIISISGGDEGDINSFIFRITDDKLLHAWEEALRIKKFKMALAKSLKSEADLSGGDLDDCRQSAWAEMRDRIMRHVNNSKSKQSIIERAPDLPASKQFVYLCPGELKALALRSVGLVATSITGGESWIPPPRILAELHGLKVCVLADDDNPRKIVHPTTGAEQILCAGMQWAERIGHAIKCNGAREVAIKWGGQQRK